MALLLKKTYHDIRCPLEATLVVSRHLKDSTLLLESRNGDAITVEEKFIPAALKTVLEAALIHSHLPQGAEKTARTDDSPFSTTASKHSGEIIPLSLSRKDIKGAQVTMSVQGAFWFAQVLTEALTHLNERRETAEGPPILLRA